MSPPRPTTLAHTLLRDHLHDGDLAIDATAGNGHDTVFLAQQVAPSGRVLAFDIQASAIQSAQSTVAAAGLSQVVDFHHTSHAQMPSHVAANSAAAVMFNLGYLPGNNHQLITTTSETLAAMAAATSCLKPNGLLTIVCYPGHPGGDQEAAAVESWATSLTNIGWRIAKYAMLGTHQPAPFLILAHKPSRPSNPR